MQLSESSGLKTAVFAGSDRSRASSTELTPGLLGPKIEVHSLEGPGWGTSWAGHLEAWTQSSLCHGHSG